MLGPADAEDPGALLIADRMAALGTLVAGVAHEINNPITYVLANLDELGRLGAAMREALLAYRARIVELLGDEASQLIAEIEMKVHQAGGLEILDEVQADAHEGAVRIREIVRDLLAVTRSAEQSWAPVNVHKILDTSLRLVAKQLAARARLEWDYQASKLVDGDRARLAQVFMNLIMNAMQALEPPDPERHRLFVRTRDTEDGVEVQIQDTGPGIPEEIRDKIFSAFFTTKEDGIGTGLGLYISRRIVEDHGGFIDVSCEPSGGTTFTVRLPGRSEGSAPSAPEG